MPRPPLARRQFIAAICLAHFWIGAAGLSAETGTTARQPNHLIHETSPYLLEHAYNPVDWYPWGEEAFAKARRENKPIFLSVGYSACHWCHVMARESFENEAVARLLNDSFVSIKVDREERPDLDRVYLGFVEETTGGGGWPMTVLLTPDLKPFFGGSYFAPDDSQGRPGLKSVLAKMAAAWKADPGAITESSNRILAEFRKQGESGAGGDKVGDHAIEAAFREMEAHFDSKSGGFGGAPKFPRPAVLTFLFEVYAADPESGRGRRALEMALFTLRKMSEGGIHDQIGGGFHRYSMDDSWHVPHFEKMLYDQALLAGAYLTAYQITREAAFADTARDILDFVRRDMAVAGGGFASSEDADSPVPGDAQVLGEGAFYVWSKAEIDGALGPGSAGLFDYCYGVEDGGNVPEGTKGDLAEKNILLRRHSTAEAAAKYRLAEAEAARSLGENRLVLYRARSLRPSPRLDDKVITSWNGLMISAYAKGYQVLGDPAYLESARAAAAFVEKTMHPSHERTLLRSYCGGRADIAGFGDDYAFMVQGLLDLYEASFDVHWLEWARQLQAEQDELFGDSAHGGYFATTGKDSHELVRIKDGLDGAEPSMNSVAALNLVRLASLFDDDAYKARGEKTLRSFADQIRRSPSSFPQMLAAADWLRGPPRQIVIAGRADGPDTLALLSEMNRHFIPRKVVILADGGRGQEYFGRQLDFFRALPASPPSPALAYVCQDFTCRLPTSDLATFAATLAPVKTPSR